MRLSDPTGLYEVRMFSDVLDAARDHLEPGRSVVLTVEATVEGDELRLLARAAQPIDVARRRRGQRRACGSIVDDAGRRAVARRPARPRSPASAAAAAAGRSSSC